MTTGIYIIQNSINNKVYVGKSVNIERRWKQYKYDFKTRRIRHINQYLLNSMIKYGYDNFKFFVQEECTPEQLTEKELFWINHHQSFNRNYGYNLRIDSVSGMKTHPLTSDKISKRLKHEWETGARDFHSEKLKESWARGDRDRKEQSCVMSRNLTKYFYIVSSDSESLLLRYNQLKSMRLHGVLGKFAKYECDKVEFKGYIIERVSISDESTNAA